MSDETVKPELAMRKPWLVAEPESIWEVTGQHLNSRDTFTNCLAMALPHYVTAGERGFAFIQPQLGDQRLIPPHCITHARRLVLVHADEPGTAYYADEQSLVGRP